MRRSRAIFRYAGFIFLYLGLFYISMPRSVLYLPPTLRNAVLAPPRVISYFYYAEYSHDDTVISAFISRPRGSGCGNDYRLGHFILATVLISGF